MLVMDRATGAFRDDSFADLGSHLRPGDLLVLNDSRVIPARLFAHRTLVRDREKPTGRIEVMLTEPAGAKSLARSRSSRPQSRHRRAPRLSRARRRNRTRSRSPRARPIRRAPARVRRRDSTTSSPCSTASATSRCRPTSIATMPMQIASAIRPSLPDERGSVAAPTAGLHFTPHILDNSHPRAIEIARVTLHVGLGTFAPLRVERVDEVRLHRERYTIAPQPPTPSTRRTRSVGGSSPSAPPSSARSKPPRSAAGRQPNPAPLRRNRHLHLARLRLPPRRRPAHQLPSAPIQPAHAGQRLRRPRTRPRRLPPRRPAERYRFFSYGDCMFIQ